MHNDKNISPLNVANAVGSLVKPLESMLAILAENRQELSSQQRPGL